LAIGHVNASASELHDDVRNGLSTWIRHLCEHRGIDLPHLSTAPDMSRTTSTSAPAARSWVIHAVCLSLSWPLGALNSIHMERRRR
jgi:hypothetical protein